MWTPSFKSFFADPEIFLSGAEDELLLKLGIFLQFKGLFLERK